MTNAKSRLVRVIALALAVLMIVPMALVGCKKTNDTPAVDQAAIDAAIKEALDAAQKAQDAADKAAQDAQAAQDKLAASEKEAADLQAQIDAMKNTTTTAAPATTTKAPVSEDQKIVEAYIATTLFDEESEYSKVVAYYTDLSIGDVDLNGIADDYVLYHKADAEKIASLIKTAQIAIQRAPSTDYVNSIVAALAADLDAVPTFSERVKEAYDAIDFASDVDVIDVVYAANLAEMAYQQIDDASTWGFAGKNLEVEVLDALKAVVKAELAALREFGDEKLDLATLINQEFYRYTGVAKVSNADATKYAEILYADEYNASKQDNIDSTIAGIFGTTVGKELKVENIVWGIKAGLGTYGGNKDAAKEIYDDYSDFYNVFKRKDYANLQEAFEIAFVGESYILIEEGNYLKDKLAEAAARIVELEAAAKEFNKPSFKGKLETIAGAFATNSNAYLYTNKKDVDKVDALLTPWLAKYNFVKGDKNLEAIINVDQASAYENFVDAKHFVDFVNGWAVKAENIDLDAVEDMIDDYNDADWAGKNEFSYSKYAAVAQALETWYNGSWNANLNGGAGAYNLDAVELQKTRLPYAGTELALGTANKTEIVNKVMGIPATDIANTLTYFRNTLVNTHVKAANDLNKLMNQIETEGLVLDSKDAKYAEKVVKDLETLFKSLLTVEYDVEDGKTIYDLKDTNADLVNWARYEEVVAAYYDASAGQAIKAEEIIKAYIAAVGAYDAEDKIMTISYDLDGKGAKNYTFEIEPAIIKFASYSKVADLKKIYEEVQISLTQGINRDIVIVDADGDDVVFDFNDAVIAWRWISERYYQGIFEAATTMALKVRNSALTDGYEDSSNAWRKNFSAGEKVSYATVGSHTNTQFDTMLTHLGQYAPEFIFVGSGASKSDKKDGSVINVFDSVAITEYGGKTYSYINAILAVNYETYITTHDAMGNVSGFDHAGYYKAVTDSLASYYDKYLSLYHSTGVGNTNTETVAKNFVEYAVKLGLWTIEDTFTIYDAEYKFVIDTTGVNDVLTVFDDDGYEYTDYIKYKASGATAFQYLKLRHVTNYTVPGIGGSTLNKYAVKIVADKYDYNDTDGDGIADTYVQVATGVDLATLIDDADILDLEYVYNFADYAEQITANIKLCPAGQRKIDNYNAWYTVVSSSYVSKVVDAYAEYEFYTTVKDAYKAMVNAAAYYGAAYTGQGTANDAIDTLLKEYTKIYGYKADNVTPLYTYGGAITIKGAELAAATFLAEVKAIVAKNSIFDKNAADALAAVKAGKDAADETGDAAIDTAYTAYKNAFDAEKVAFEAAYAAETSFAAEKANIATALATLQAAIAAAVAANPATPAP